jgi:hypothetical protein
MKAILPMSDVRLSGFLTCCAGWLLSELCFCATFVVPHDANINAAKDIVKNVSLFIFLSIL